MESQIFIHIYIFVKMESFLLWLWVEAIFEMPKFYRLALIVKLAISEDYVTDGYNYFGDSITTETEPVVTTTLETSPDSESEDYSSVASSKGGILLSRFIKFRANIQNQVFWGSK